MKSTTFFPFFLLLLHHQLSQTISQSLTTQSLLSNWKFNSQGNTTQYPATVPGTVHLDLINNRLLEDPYYRMNAEAAQWVENITWIYTSTFDADPPVMQSGKVEIVFEGLDTHATVVLNNKTIIEGHNMWRRWVADVKDLLQAKGNILTVTFYPATLYDQDKVKKMKPLNMPSDFDAGRIYSRKAAYHFGWDWGPRLVTAGIWKSVYLQGWSGAKIEGVNLPITELNNDHAFVNAEIELSVDIADEYQISVSNADTGVVYVQSKANFTVTNETTIFGVSFYIKNPKLWWVRNLGEPYLYPLKIELIYQNKTIHQKTFNLGLRTIELVQENDSIGQSFYFKINGVPVYAKGGNYIPPDIFMPRVTNKTYEQIIKDAADANYNFIRVWGGGNYENDYFYDLCDKYGILVWQDFMFANAMYPGDDQDYLANLSQEITENIKRLRTHPSLAIWCGNNEIKNGWEDWGYQTSLKEKQIKTVYEWYQNIFLNIIPNLLKNLDQSRPYWASSPLHGYTHPESFSEGDNHFYGVWVQNAPIEDYRTYVGRFMSEYGVQGFPALNSVKKYTLPEDRWLKSSVIQYHQKGAAADYHMNFYVLAYFRNATDFEKYLYLTQIMQAYAIQTAIEAHRYKKPQNMGTLMWQLNDAWPGFSWSSRDYYGAWKAVHYMIKRKYQDVIVSVVPSVDADRNPQYDVYIVSEKLSDFNGTLSVVVMDLNGTVYYSKVQGITCKKSSSEKWLTITNDIFSDLDQTRTFIYANFTFDLADQNFAETTTYFVTPRHLELENPNIKLQVDLLNETFSIESDTLAVGVCIYIEDVEIFLNDNCFDLIPNQPKYLKLLRTVPAVFGLENSVFNILHLYKSYSLGNDAEEILIHKVQKEVGGGGFLNQRLRRIITY